MKENGGTAMNKKNQSGFPVYPRTAETNGENVYRGPVGGSGVNIGEGPIGASGANIGECPGTRDALPPHGGDVYGALAGGQPEPLDFSANISPLGLPEGVRRSLAERADEFTRYPDPHCRMLRAALSEKHGILPGHIVCGAGSADLIFRAARALRPRRALVTAPAFSEYGRAAAEAGAEVSHYPLSYPGFAITEGMREAVTGTDLAFLCNPNNPTGVLTPRETIRGILLACEKAGAVLIVDECFMDLVDDPGAFTAEPLLTGHDNLIILKAYTKTYAMAGLRLGYALCGSASVAGRIAETGPPWSVSAPAQIAGVSALKETAYLGELRAIVQKERGRLKAGLAAIGTEVLGGSANYVFFRIEGQPGSGANAQPGEGAKSLSSGANAQPGSGANAQPGDGAKSLGSGANAQPGEGAKDAEGSLPAPIAGRGIGFAAAMAGRGILIRDCSNFKGLEDGTYFRAAVRLPEENDIFLRAAQSALKDT